MATSMQVEFVKVLACLAWADEEVTNTEMNFIKRFVHRFDLNGDEWVQVEMYLVEQVNIEEMKRVTRHFLSRVRKASDRKMLVEAVEHLLGSDDHIAEGEKEWLREMKDTLSTTKKSIFLIDELKSLLRIGGAKGERTLEGREADLHDFIHNRVLFKLRRRLGSGRLEKEGTPEKLKKLTLSCTMLGLVGFVDDNFLPQEEAFIRNIIQEVWGASQSLSEAVMETADEAIRQGMDLHRLVKEVKEIMSMTERKLLLEGIFALSLAEGKMSNEEVEEIRKIAYMLDFTHKQFIAAKLKVVKQFDSPKS